ncbi:MAG: DUF1330 domain-containing protein [Microthrixaceae bacterium]
MSDTHVNPSPEAITGLMQRAADGDDRPVVMLNLNRYRPVAAYPEDHPDAGSGLSGREAYLRYGVVAKAAIDATGGRILWVTDAGETVIGCDHDAIDEVVAVWYPSRAAFLRLGEYPGYFEATVHRDAAVEQAVLIACDGEQEPALRSPFG